MTTSIKYIGILDPYFEIGVTGKQGVWHRGQISDVPDADAALLVSTGLFQPSSAEQAVDGGNPLSITGTLGIGSVLSATLAAGWSVTGYQWYRNSGGGPVAISGATSSTYTQVTADAGTTLTVRGTGLIYTSPVGAQVPALAPTGVYRFASAFNRIPSKTQNGSAVYASRYGVRYTHIIGTGDRSALKVILQNWYGNINGTSNPGNTATYSSMYLEHAGAGVSVPVLIGGASSYTMADGEADKLTDAVLPSAFGLSKFTVGDIVYIRVLVDIPISGKLVQNNYTDSSDTNCKTYDPGATACTNISGTGALTFSGTAPGGAACPPMQLIGTFVGGDPSVWLANGDSIMEGFYDSTGATAKIGTGAFSKALYNGGGANTLAGMNAGVFGSGTNLWTVGSAKMNTLLKYANRVYYEMGTNYFDGGANGTPAVATLITNTRNVWTQLRANALSGSGLTPIKILGQVLLPRTLAAADGSLPFGPKYDIAGDMDTYNTSLVADVGVAGRLDAYCDLTPASRLGSDPATTAYHQWANGTVTQDGLHPLGALAASNAAIIRASMNLLAA
jgi:hypothetical protein